MADMRRYYDPETRTFLPGARINIEQYAILKRCSEHAGDISEWQQYRKEHANEPIWLSGAQLRGCTLRSPAYDVWAKDNLPRNMTLDDHITTVPYYSDLLDLRAAHLEGASLSEAQLNGADLSKAYLQGASLNKVRLCGAKAEGAHLEASNSSAGHFEGAVLCGARFFGAMFQTAHFEGAHFLGSRLCEAHVLLAHLDNADFSGADLSGCTLAEVRMRGSTFRRAKVNGNTMIWGSRTKIDRRTDFTGVALDSARVEPGLKQLLEYNVRRLGWVRWYGTGPWWLRVLKRLIVWPFWRVSDYGRSTLSILVVFLGLAAAFAGAYCLWPQLLTLSEPGGELRGPWHALYFSVVTQTTLGFGDIHANPDSPVGQGLLMLQVILGYVLLGALVTRFAVLFTAGGPAGQFSSKPRKKRLWRTWLYVFTHPLMRPMRFRGRHRQ